MRRLGQHFIKSTDALKKALLALELSARDTVVEIGPGHGELTFPILKKISEEEARGSIVAIEKDVKLFNALALRHSAGLRLINGDALKLLPEVVADLPLGESQTYKIAGNIPYYITGHLLRTIGELPKKPARTVLMVQKEVAERITAKPPKMNRLAASVQFWAEAKIVADIPKEQFSPPPQVDSSLILLETKQERPSPEPARYYKAVAALFAQPRKTIANNIFAAREENREKISRKLQTVNVDPGKRPQDLSVRDIQAITDALF